MYPILITAGDVTLRAELDDTPNARQIWNALPLEASAQVWGGEIYFSAPLKADLEPDAREQMAAGELAYWPDGEVLCIFFGPTPASTGSEPRAASPVNVVGRVTSSTERLSGVRAGDPVRVIRAVVA